MTSTTGHFSLLTSQASRPRWSGTVPGL